MAQHSAHTGSHGGHGHHSDSSHDEAHGSFKSYLIGFLLSIVLTIIPLVVVLNHWLEGTGAMVVMLGSAVLQFVVQLVFFMHLREEKKPRWNLMALLLGLLILLVIVIGSIWIMAYNQVAQ
ncbi:cytochrome o ubiquinol oxidase subunit IV [Paenibacillus ginsengarvi]|uniref:Cytochrome o ubiquinol oxidase subunit IV n=1 Tax=Paenibacillus ginsengarvi TaxID=400777 RepID=A0A3B0AQ68_9BACL|nr:cytochrome o ubiquinol oxidase subunit IV [Paenibacillus ginsengarvi]RKN62789.1 cytochrome o ubiquinol oxidase subunit IV [Paenibacillus ginsengarvi]